MDGTISDYSRRLRSGAVFADASQHDSIDTYSDNGVGEPNAMRCTNGIRSAAVDKGWFFAGVDNVDACRIGIHAVRFSHRFAACTRSAGTPSQIW
jgi:hypothetical protein